MSSVALRHVEVARDGLAAAFGSARTDWPAAPTLVHWVFDAPVLVLGSAQPDAVVDAGAARRAGVEVVRRASGGGAVLLVPGGATWVDLVVPADDPRHHDDLVVAARVLGDAWVRALVACGIAPARLERHAGRAVAGPWSSLVCFGGTGPGEVRLDGRKVVGISQRRTRAGTRFQVAVLRRWEPAALLGLLALDPAARADALGALAGVATGVDVDPDVLVAAFATALAHA